MINIQPIKFDAPAITSMPNQKPINIVAIEGIDGSGKTTVINAVEQNYNRTKPSVVPHFGAFPIQQMTPIINDYNNFGVSGFFKYNFVFTSEPRKNTPYRNMLLNSKSSAELDANTKLALVTADRYEHIKEIQNSTNADGIITDRYNDSTWVYQVVLGGVAPELFYEYEKIFNIQQPNIVILLDISPTKAFERLKARGGEINYFDNVSLEEKERMREAYLGRAFRINNPYTQYVVIDAAMDINLIISIVDSIVIERKNYNPIRKYYNDQSNTVLFSTNTEYFNSLEKYSSGNIGVFLVNN